MKWIFICGLLLLAMCCSGCMAKTQARLSYTAEGAPVIDFFDNKSRNGVKLEVIPQENGSPKIIYTVESSDANAVALKAIGLAEKATESLAPAAGMVMGVPVK